ncbi:MAG: TadE/TadG family type IV pilus assembly protein [Propionibacteriaceae bacterium]|nr:TadE/TadG family type IV pilus assembly protein [Propionibacteriaceae bacterium]
MRARDERGLSESVQWAVLTPLLMLLLLGALQVGMLWHGRNTTLHAAAEAAHAESVFGATTGSGLRVAENIARAGGLNDVSVVVDRSGDRVDVRVSATVPVLIDLGLGRVSQSASAPLERVP